MSDFREYFVGHGQLRAAMWTVVVPVQPLATDLANRREVLSRRAVVCAYVASGSALIQRLLVDVNSRRCAVTSVSGLQCQHGRKWFRG